MSSRVVRLFVFVAIGLSFLAPSARAAAVDPVAVDKAIKFAKEYVYSQQNAEGNWELAPKRDETPAKRQEVIGSRWGQNTALCVLALIASGDSPQDPKLTRAIQFLMKADIIGTDAIGFRCQVMMLLPETPETKALLKKDVGKLLDYMKRDGPGRGFYDVDNKGKPTEWALARSQYAVLGVWAGELMDVKVPPAYWREVQNAWSKTQEKDGGWRFWPGKDYPPVTAGVTAVGVATMFIVQDQLYGNRGIDCKEPTELPAIDKGLDWMLAHFDKVAPSERVDREFPCPNLYAIERVGVASGLKYFGKHDWYAHGVEYLLEKQRKDGSWGGGMSYISDTPFGILFLSRGRAPVIFNKLKWSGDEKTVAGGNWNLRPRDVANLTRWIGHTSERDLNWQIVTPEAPIADWHDSPITYISGSKALDVPDELQKKLRQYVDEGGMLVLHVDCGKPEFLNSAQKLAKDLYPGYEFRELPAEHPIYTAPYSREKWKNKPKLLGLSNGVRELIILLPDVDPAKTWQLNVFKGKEEVWQLGANIVYYAADQRDLRNKGQSHYVAANPDAKTTGSLKVARMSYKNGNWDPEPGAWRRMATLLKNRDGLDVQVQEVQLAYGDLDGFKLAHLTGTTKIKLDEHDKKQLQRFIANGGTLVVDAAGGSQAFADSIEPELASLGTGAKLETLSANHSIFGGKGGMKVGYRPYAQRVLTGEKLNIPHIKAVRVGDRLGVIFSREDITAGMVGQPVGGIVGYTPGTATELMRRFSLRAAGIEPDAVAKAEKKPAKDGAKPAKGEAKPKAPAKPKPADGSGLD